MQTSQVAQMVKNPPTNARYAASILGLGRSPGEGNGNPLQYSSGAFHGQRSLEGYSPWGHKELDTTERLSLFHFELTKSELLGSLVLSRALHFQLWDMEEAGEGLYEDPSHTNLPLSRGSPSVIR